MMHWRARRLLPAVYDGTLPELAELEVQVHALGCARCRRAMREFEFAETILQRMPASLLPLEWSPTSYGRLASLSRWSLEPKSDPERWRAPALGFAGLVALVLMFFSTGMWSPALNDPTTDAGVSSSHYSADASFLPLAWNPGGP
jgi:anti-sigma factor RsiW